MKRTADEAALTEAQRNALSRHFSWSDFTIGDKERKETFRDIASFQEKEAQLLQAELAKGEASRICGTQIGCVPIYDAVKLSREYETSPQLQKETERFAYEHFFNGAGVLIVRGAYTQETMNRYNAWCEDYIARFADKDPNCRHPKQKGKYLINEVINRLSETDPDTCLDLIANRHYLGFCDALLGFMKYGAATAHWIEAKSDRQLSHVDYPMHVGSGPFWEHSPEKAMRLTTRHQMNEILSKFSVQSLVASDKMDASNGSTEVVPCTHRLRDIDMLIHDGQIYDGFEPMFRNVQLEQGDLLIFNRRLMHRGGRNESAKRRNSLITQNVYLWGVGQEIFDGAECLARFRRSRAWAAMGEEERAALQVRLCPPYPRDTKLST